jgi:hypothetical protein
MSVPPTSTRIQDALAAVEDRIAEGPGDDGLAGLVATALVDGVDVLRRPGGRVDPDELTGLFTAVTADDLTGLDWSMFAPEDPDALREFLCARLAERDLLERVTARFVTADREA